VALSGCSTRPPLDRRSLLRDFEEPRRAGNLGIRSEVLGEGESLRWQGEVEIGSFTTTVVETIRKGRWLWIWRNLFMQLGSSGLSRKEECASAVSLYSHEWTLGIRENNVNKSRLTRRFPLPCLSSSLPLLSPWWGTTACLIWVTRG
jgi:hypothetical protein